MAGIGNRALGAITQQRVGADFENAVIVGVEVEGDLRDVAALIEVVNVAGGEQHGRTVGARSGQSSIIDGQITGAVRGVGRDVSGPIERTDLRSGRLRRCGGGDLIDLNHWQATERASRSCDGNVQPACRGIVGHAADLGAAADRSTGTLNFHTS